MCLVGNKNDLEESRQVNVKDAQEYADSIGALFHETSALKNVGKDTLNLCLGTCSLQRIEKWVEHFLNVLTFMKVAQIFWHINRNLLTIGEALFSIASQKSVD